LDEQVRSEALAEATGSFCLVFVGAAVVCTDSYSAGGVGAVGVALAHGLVLAAVVTAFGHISGAHVNPAVTFATVLVGETTPVKAGMYVASQLLGACLAGLTLLIIFGTDVWDPVALGTPQLGVGVTPATALLVEALLTFILVLTVLLVAIDHRAPEAVYGLVIGAVLAAGVLVAGPLTGGAMNPARALGPAFAAGAWQAHYVYWLGPAAGAAAAALCFSGLRDRARLSAEELFAAVLEERDEAIEEAERLRAEARTRLRIVDDPPHETD
jgi:MIP family channel proteins